MRSWIRLPCPIIVDSVLKHQRDQGQAKGAVRTHDLQPGNAVQFPLQGYGDLLFDFFGGVPRILRDDLRRDVGDVRDKLRFSAPSTRNTEDRHQNGDEPYHLAAFQAKRDETVDHWRRAPRE